jgi:hypothetical protein
MAHAVAEKVATARGRHDKDARDHRERYKVRLFEARYFLETLYFLETINRRGGGVHREAVTRRLMTCA